MKEAKNAILEYWEEIQTGGVTVGKWIRQLYEVILKGIDEGRWSYDERLADNAVNFIQRFCHHYKGALAPKRIQLSVRRIGLVRSRAMNSAESSRHTLPASQYTAVRRLLVP